MTATARLKQLLYIAAALALVGLGLVAAVSTASPARAADPQPCVPQDAFTETVVDEPAFTETVVDQEAFDETVIDKPAFTETVVDSPAVPGFWTNFQPNDTKDPFVGPPGYPTDERGSWSDPKTDGGPQPDASGVFANGNADKGGNWFYRQQAVPEQSHEVQHPAETHVVHHPAVTHEVFHPAVTHDVFHPAVTCDPPADTSKKVVVCKYVGTPPGTPDHIIVVSVNAIPGFPDPAVFPFEFADAQKSVAIRFAVGNEQPGDEELANCPVEPPPPAVCPDDSDHPGMEIPDGQTAEEVCFDQPAVCPDDSDHPGMEIPDGQTAEEVCFDEPNPGPVTCPEGTDKAGEDIPADKTAEEFCNDDDKNPPNPGEPNGPSNHPNPGPTVKGAQATSPTASQSTPKAAGAPAALVPTAVDAGLAPAQRDLTGSGGPLGLLGIATALAGAGLVGASLRPRRGRSLTG